MQGKQQAEGSGDALAAFKTEEDRVEMADKGAGAGQCGDQRTKFQPAGDQYGNDPFEYIAQQCQGRGRLATDTQHIGGAGVVGALSPWVRIAEQAADQNGAGNGAHQVASHT